jgi:transposase
MEHYTIGIDAHKKYSIFAVMDEQGRIKDERRVEHQTGAIRTYLEGYPAGTPVALESVGNWYWIVDEIEAAGCQPLIAHAIKAKVMMGNVNKTDKLDARGLATLERLNSLPRIWIPDGGCRDERELPRTRMALSKLRTAVKNRIHATLAKYNRRLETQSDIFAPKWRDALWSEIEQLPPETRRCMQQELEMLDELKQRIKTLERWIKETIQINEQIQLVDTLPGVGEILAIVIEREIGDVNRFPSSEHLASYAGVVPKVHASGGRTRHGRMRKQANQYLKWAFIEAANVVTRMRNHPNWRNRHITRLYNRVRRRKGHPVAVGAVARHLAEATYWVLKKREPYKEPGATRKVLSRQG